MQKAPGKGLGVSVSGIGHSDIRGLVTYRSMVRREPCRLLAWITVSCADIVQSQMARTSKWPKPFQDVFRCFLAAGRWYVAQAILHLLNYPQQQRAGNVKGLPPQAVPCTLDFDSTVLYHGLYDIVCHHAPHEACKFPGNCCFCHICFFVL